MINAQALFFSVVNKGNANAVLSKAREYGAAGGMIFIGEGTVRSKFLQQIGLAESQKEILMISAPSEVCSVLHQRLSVDFKFHKRNKGIAFTIPFKRYGAHVKTIDDAAGSPYSCIMAIIDKGRAGECIKAARAAGARGGTLLHGTGAGIFANFYYPLIIEPQKEILMIITSKHKASSIRKSILNRINSDMPRSGFVFTLPVTDTSGLSENRYSDRQRGVKS